MSAPMRKACSSVCSRVMPYMKSSAYIALVMMAWIGGCSSSPDGATTPQPIGTLAGTPGTTPYTAGASGTANAGHVAVGTSGAGAGVIAVAGRGVAGGGAVGLGAAGVRRRRGSAAGSG